MQDFATRFVPMGRVPLAALVVLFAVSGCSDPFRTVTSSPASPGLTKAALNLEKPTADRARVIIFNGGRIDGTYRPRNYSIRVSVNGVRIGAMNPNEAMVFEVVPGRYVFDWESLDGKALLEKGEPGTYTLGAGELLPLQADFDNYVLKMNQGFGPNQLTTDGESGRQKIQPDIEIVRPSNCPTSICLAPI